MVILVKIFSIVVMLYGAFLILRPETLKKVFKSMRDKYNFYIAGASKAVAGLVLILAASDCRVPWVIMFFGSLSLFGGILAFVIRIRLITELFDWMEQQPPRFTHYVGAIALLIGIIMALAA